VKAKPKESLDTERFNNALAKIKAGGYTVEQLKAKFSLTKEQEAAL
jgi:ABC-type amino acid transport substrate-binding protein